jgi:hypothetical protein
MLTTEGAFSGEHNLENPIPKYISLEILLVSWIAHENI